MFLHNRGDWGDFRRLRRLAVPKSSKVHKLFDKLKSEGKSAGSAARIAQSATGLALATGKPPKHSSKSRKK